MTRSRRRVTASYAGVTIQPDRETLLELEVPRGVDRQNKIMPPMSGLDRMSIQAVWRNAEGTLLWQDRHFYTHRNKDSWILRTRLAIGTYDLSLESAAGYHGSARIKVESLEPDNKVIEIVMRKR